MKNSLAKYDVTADKKLFHSGRTLSNLVCRGAEKREIGTQNSPSNRQTWKQNDILVILNVNFFT